MPSAPLPNVKRRIRPLGGPHQQRALRAVLEACIERNNWNVVAAGVEIGVSRSKMYDMLRKRGIRRTSSAPPISDVEWRITHTNGAGVDPLPADWPRVSTMYMSVPGMGLVKIGGGAPYRPAGPEAS